MATEFTILMEDKPGTAADALELLGNAGVNIDAILAHGGKTVAIVPGDPERTRQALDGAGRRYSTREVLVLDVEDKPGALARLARAMGNAQVDLDAIYLDHKGQVVLAAHDLAAARQVALRLGVS